MRLPSLQPMLNHTDASSQVTETHRFTRARGLKGTMCLEPIAPPLHCWVSLVDQTWRKNSPISHCSYSAVPRLGSLAVKRLLNIPFAGGRATRIHARPAACQEQPEVSNKGSQQEPPIKCPTLSPARTTWQRASPRCTPCRAFSELLRCPQQSTLCSREPRGSSALLSLVIFLILCCRTEARQRGAAV